jgi:hypothetical protein
MTGEEFSAMAWYASAFSGRAKPWPLDYDDMIRIRQLSPFASLGRRQFARRDGAAEQNPDAFGSR